MQFKTSTLIAQKFTAYVSGLLLLLWVVLNLFFFITRYRNESIKIQWWWPLPGFLSLWTKNGVQKKQTRKPLFIPLLDKTHLLKINDEVYNDLLEWKIRKNISYIDENYIIYTINKGKNELIFSYINEQIDAQRRLLQISWFFILLFAFITYGISYVFVRSSLYRVNNLLVFVQWLNIHNLNSKVPKLWPENDEIQIIANKLQESLNTIKWQTDALKNFISYASHELKTPLMSINALVDLWEKTGNYPSIKEKIKNSLSHMNNLIEQLLTQLKAQGDSVSQTNEQCDIGKVVWETIEQMRVLYPQHTIQLLKRGSDSSSHYQATINEKQLHTVISNILQNACKYSNPWTIVQVTLDKNSLSIKDEGIGIASSDKEKIWWEFYRVDQEKEGYGLWLSIVKKIIDQHHRTIELQSKKNRWSEFIISYT